MISPVKGTYNIKHSKGLSRRFGKLFINRKREEISSVNYPESLGNRSVSKRL